MTISSTTNRVSYAGNAVTTAFSFPYYFIADADLVIISRVDATGVETTKALTTHYTVAGAGVTAGGTVTMLAAPAAGVTLTIYRDPARTQDLNLGNLDSFPADDVETRLDKVAMWVQRLYDLVSRSVRLTDGNENTFDTKLPVNMTAGAVLQVNSAGTGWTFADASVTTAAAPQLLTAGTGVVVTAAMFQVVFIGSNTGANVDMSSTNPQIAAGTLVGQRVVLACVDATYTITFANGNGLYRNGSYAMINGSVSEYLWDGSKWRMISDNQIG